MKKRKSPASEAVENALQVLSEHFTAVQILGTFEEDDGSTRRVCRGRGNYYARMGMVQEFVNNEMARENAAEISRSLKND